MKTISLLHPFTPQAAGVVEKSVAVYHSQPHLKALQMLREQMQFECSIDYFTTKFFNYSFKHHAINYRFYPVSFTLNGDHKKWKKQRSKACLKAYAKNTPDVTIINMSGHSSPFSYELSKLILENGKKYIAMLGGRHYTDVAWLREYYQKAHHILVHTQLQKQEMQQLPLFEDCDIRVMPLGVDTNVFKSTVKKTQDTLQLLYVGRIVELKRIHLAIEIVHKLVSSGVKNVSLKIVGPVSSKSYKDELERMILEKNLSNNVFFEGFKKHNELVDYFNQSDLLLLPSKSESFGMVVVESMSCGTPVAVVKGVVGPEDIISHQKDGLVSTLETYVPDVVNLLLDEKKLIEMKKNARQKVIDHYSIEATARVLFQSVEDALRQ